jgi:hypothetical protein
VFSDFRELFSKKKKTEKERVGIYAEQRRVRRERNCAPPAD